MALKRNELKAVRTRQYLARDFDSMRAQLLDYARRYYPDKIKDFSENSLGGVFLDFAAMTGDVMSFYLDHQYGELDPENAVETINIERHIKNAGVTIVGAAPALVKVTIYVQVPAETVNNVVQPRNSCIPIVGAGSIFVADNGVEFVLLEDVDFGKLNSDSNLSATVRVDQKTTSGIPTSYIMAAEGLCVSGKETTDTVSLGSFTPFQRVTLTNPHVSQIISVVDGLGNQYHQVSSLTNDVVYKNVLNTAVDADDVKDSLYVVPAPYRYTASCELASRRTVMTLGGGSADTLEDDVIPDPADFAISFPYTTTFSRVAVNPQQLLSTKTLGVRAVNTTLQITYRHGGGLNHNVGKNAIRTVKTLKMSFPNSPTAAQAAAVKGSIEVSNARAASGGDDAPSIDSIKELIPASRNAQERIVTREDVLARVYTLPSNFGRVYRAAVRSNPNNPLATQLFVISRDQSSKLTVSPDTLKKNLKRYLNPYRMVSDAIDILDARVINLQVAFDLIIDPALTRSIVLQNVLTRLQTTFNIKNFHIDQPIVASSVRNEIYSVPGVISVNNLRFDVLTGQQSGRTYSDESYDIQANTRHDIVYPPPGGIFEIRYPEHDVIGRTAF